MIIFPSFPVSRFARNMVCWYWCCTSISGKRSPVQGPVLFHMQTHTHTHTHTMYYKCTVYIHSVIACSSVVYLCTTTAGDATATPCYTVQFQDHCQGFTNCTLHTNAIYSLNLYNIHTIVLQSRVKVTL